MTTTPQILVLGVGNILFSDEGVGVRVIEALQEEYDFSPNVNLMDGGTLGSKLMGPIMECDHLIVVDAVRGGDAPGSLYRLVGEDLRKSLAFINSMHDTDLVDTLIYCEMAGKRPEAVVIGIEPHDMQTMAVQLSEPSLRNMPHMKRFVLEEIEKTGGSFHLKTTNT